MSRLTTQILTAAAVSAAALALSACGGGSSSPGINGPFLVSPTEQTCYLGDEVCGPFRIQGGVKPYRVESPDQTLAPTKDPLEGNEYSFKPLKTGKFNLRFTTDRTASVAGAGGAVLVPIVVNPPRYTTDFKVVPAVETNSCKKDGNCVESGSYAWAQITLDGDAISGSVEFRHSSPNWSFASGKSYCGPITSINGAFPTMLCLIKADDVTEATGASIRTLIVTNAGETIDVDLPFTITIPQSNNPSPTLPKLELDTIGNWGAPGSGGIDCQTTLSGSSLGFGGAITTPSTPVTYSFDVVAMTGITGFAPKLSGGVLSSAGVTTFPATATTQANAPGTITLTNTGTLTLSADSIILVSAWYTDSVSGNPVTWSKPIYCKP